MPSEASSRVAARPSAENGTFTTTRSSSPASARPSATMSRALSDTTSAEVGPSTSSQMRLIASPGSPSSLASSDGFVVAPESTPQAAISSTSATEPVSMKNLMAMTLLLACRDPLQPLVVGIERGHRALAPQHPAHRQEVGRGADIVHADDRGAAVSGLGERSQRAREPLLRRPAGDRPDEVLARDGGEDRA